MWVWESVDGGRHRAGRATRGWRRWLSAFIGTIALVLGWAASNAAAAAPAQTAAVGGGSWQPPADLPAPPVGAMVGAASDVEWDLYLTSATGGRPEPLTGYEDESPYYAEFDPLGQRIAVSSWKGLYLATADGTGKKLVPTTSAYGDFSWHPQQADHLVATKAKGVVTIALTAGNPVVKTLPIPFRPSSVTYSPDGTKLLAIRNDGSTGYDDRAYVYRADGTGGQQVKLTKDAHDIQWNPTGDGLIYGDYHHGFERKLGAAKSTTLFPFNYGSIRGTDAAGRVLFSDDRDGNGKEELYGYQLDGAVTTLLASPHVILDHYSASPIGPNDLGSCDGLKATITGTEGNDRITGTAGDDIIRGLGGNDVINGLGGNDILCGGDGADTLSGGTGDDRVFGDAGADKLQGNDGDDRVGGGSGADIIDAGSGNDRADGGSENDTVNGGAGADELRGGFGDDRLDGGLDADSVYGEPGADIVHGGSGNDFLLGEYRWTNPAHGSDRVYGDAGNDDVRQASGPDGELWGGAGNDSLWEAPKGFGGDGDDRLEHVVDGFGGPGDEYMAHVTNNFGEGGNDHIRLTADHCWDGCIADGGDGNDTLEGSIDEDVIRGGVGSDTITANMGDDNIRGDAGVDTINGGFGNDTISGGDDADQIQGDSGNDVVAGGGGDDTIAGGTGADTIRGGDGNDVISAFDQDDKLFGDAGDDRLTGGSGNDRLDGGVGTDRCDGSAGVDTGLRCEIRVSLEH